MTVDTSIVYPLQPVKYPTSIALMTHRSGSTIAQSELGLHLAKRRDQLGLTQEAFADLVGMSQEWVAKVSSGEIKTPKLSTLRKVAEAIGDPVSELVYLAGYAESELTARRIADQAAASDDDGERDLAIEALTDILLTTIATIERLPHTAARGRAIRQLRDAMKAL